MKIATRGRMEFDAASARLKKDNEGEKNED